MFILALYLPRKENWVLVQASWMPDIFLWEPSVGSSLQAGASSLLVLVLVCCLAVYCTSYADIYKARVPQSSCPGCLAGWTIIQATGNVWQFCRYKICPWHSPLFFVFPNRSWVTTRWQLTIQQTSCPWHSSSFSSRRVNLPSNFLQPWKVVRGGGWQWKWLISGMRSCLRIAHSITGISQDWSQHNPRRQRYYDPATYVIILFFHYSNLFVVVPCAHWALLTWVWQKMVECQWNGKNPVKILCSRQTPRWPEMGWLLPSIRSRFYPKWKFLYSFYFDWMFLYIQSLCSLTLKSPDHNWYEYGVT